MGNFYAIDTQPGFNEGIASFLKDLLEKGGLDAIMALDQDEFSARFEVSGVIVQGGLPEMPDPAPVRFEYQE